jgi:hypothetical protein
VLSKSEGQQKWLAPCGTDVHRVARTIDVSILEKESHRQSNMIMRNEVLIAQNMENLGAKSVCLLEQLRPLLRTWIFVTCYYKGNNVQFEANKLYHSGAFLFAVHSNAIHTTCCNMVDAWDVDADYL